MELSISNFYDHNNTSLCFFGNIPFNAFFPLKFFSSIRVASINKDCRGFKSGLSLIASISHLGGTSAGGQASSCQVLHISEKHPKVQIFGLAVLGLYTGLEISQGNKLSLKTASDV